MLTKEQLIKMTPAEIKEHDWKEVRTALSDHSFLPAEPKCKRCGHDKTEHSIGNAEYVEGMPDSSCYWGDDEEVCECRAYRPPATTEVEKTGGAMNIEQIKERITEIRKLSNEILAGKESQEKNR